MFLIVQTQSADARPCLYKKATFPENPKTRNPEDFRAGRLFARFPGMAATIDEIYDDLLDNADFEEVASLAKAKAFVTAATRFLILSPQAQSDQGSSMTLNASQIENLLIRAREFVAKNQTGRGAVRFLSTSQGFRR